MLYFVPETIIFGVISGKIDQAIFIAIVIAAQNIPEGYEAYNQMAKWRNGNNLIRC
jgi:hypothetical protein